MSSGLDHLPIELIVGARRAPAAWSRPSATRPPAGGPPRTSPRARAACSSPIRANERGVLGADARTARSRRAATSSGSRSRPRPRPAPARAPPACVLRWSEIDSGASAPNTVTTERVGRKAALDVQRLPGADLLVLGEAQPDLAGLAERRAVKAARKPAAGQADHQPQRAPDRHVGAPAGAERADPAVEADRIAHRAVDHHHLPDGLGGDRLAADVEGRLECRLDRGDDHREVLGAAAGEHRARGHALERHRGPWPAASHRAARRDRDRRASPPPVRGVGGITGRPSVQPRSNISSSSSKPGAVERAQRLPRRRCSWPRTPACDAAARGSTRDRQERAERPSRVPTDHARGLAALGVDEHRRRQAHQLVRARDSYGAGSARTVPVKPVPAGDSGGDFERILEDRGDRGAGCRELGQEGRQTSQRQRAGGALLRDEQQERRSVGVEVGQRDRRARGGGQREVGSGGERLRSCGGGDRGTRLPGGGLGGQGPSGHDLARLQHHPDARRVEQDAGCPTSGSPSRTSRSATAPASPCPRRAGRAPGRAGGRRRRSPSSGRQPALDHADQLDRVVTGRSAVIAHGEGHACGARGHQRPRRPPRAGAWPARRGAGAKSSVKRSARSWNVRQRRARGRSRAPPSVPGARARGGARGRARSCRRPASTAIRAPSRPSAWAATRNPSRWASSTIAVELARGSSGRARDPREHRARAGGHELDEVGAAAKLLADGPAHVVGAVGLAVHGGEDRAARRGRGDDPPARQDPRPLDDPEPDRLAQRDRLVVVAADVANAWSLRPRAAPARSWPARSTRARVGAGSSPLSGGRRTEAWAAADVARQVGVGVDQPRHHRAAVEVEPAVDGRGGYLDDSPVLDPHRRLLERGAAGAVDHARVGENHMLGDRTPPTSRPEDTSSRTRSTSPASERSSATGGTSSATSDTASSSAGGSAARGQIPGLAEGDQLVGQRQLECAQHAVELRARRAACGPGSPPGRWRRRWRGCSPARPACAPGRRFRSPACAGRSRPIDVRDRA